MPHICTRCTRVYPDASEVVLKGCSCGNTSFLYQRNRHSYNNGTEVSKAETDKPQGNHDPDLVNTENSRNDKDSIESIRIVRPGEYDINLVQMAQSSDRVIKIGEDGEYRLNLHSMIRKKKK